ncbi:MAG: GNAT family N-acetyltransferase [Ruminococcus sp.]|nr:GNAT family N-acetyltransferase [Ruminococcus sp.]
MLYLKSANFEDIEKEWQFQRDIPSEEDSFINEYHDIGREDFNTVLDTIIEQSRGVHLPEGYVPQTIFYLWNDNEIVGTFHLRHYLCESLMNGAGHIGYYIAPEYRGMGYATNGLKLILEEARKTIPEKEIFLRCDKDNTASLKVMLNNKGYIHHEDEYKYYVRIAK